MINKSPRAIETVNHRQTRTNLSLISILFLGMALAPAHGALTQKDLENKIKEAKVLRNGERISLSPRGEECLIHKYRAPESTDTEKDCKIDAVLLSKVVMNADSSVKKVRVRFFELSDPSRYSEVLVGLPAIKAFGMGALTHADLLASLDVTHGVDASHLPPPAATSVPAPTNANASAADSSASAGAETSLGVVDGPSKEERAKLLGQIKELSERRINTKVYTEQFLLMEEKAKQGDKFATTEILDRLSVSVTAQLKALSQQGKRPVRGSSDYAAGSATAGGDLSEGSESEDLHEKMKDVMYKMSKKYYGNFTPVPGPYESDRSLISTIVLSKKKQGFNVTNDEKLCADLNNLASRGDKATLSKKIPAMFQYLHITQDQVNEWRKQRGQWDSKMGGW